MCLCAFFVQKVSDITDPCILWSDQFSVFVNVKVFWCRNCQTKRITEFFDLVHFIIFVWITTKLIRDPSVTKLQKASDIKNCCILWRAHIIFPFFMTVNDFCTEIVGYKGSLNYLAWPILLYFLWIATELINISFCNRCKNRKTGESNIITVQPCFTFSLKR